MTLKEQTTPTRANPSTYDVLIIGGGIQGCGVAQAMAAKGYSVLLVEKNTLGSGTSSKSSKLIHGGLRYLESGQFTLVRKSLRERSLLCELAPSLVSLKKFYIPVYRASRLSSMKVAAGLSLYSMLGGLEKQSQFRKLKKHEWGQLSGLNENNLVAVYEYHDAQTNDKALTQAVANSAKTLGATLYEHCVFNGAKFDSVTNSVKVTLHQEGQPETEVSCSCLVNAAGPWVEHTQSRIKFGTALPPLSLIQGSHIEFDQPIGDGIFYVESPIDQRPVFVMPGNQGGLLVGTTERQFTGNADGSTPHPDEIDYLQQTLKHYFPDYSGKLTDSWSGLRVLPGLADNDSSKILRPFSHQARDTIFHLDFHLNNESTPRLLTICGGKLTTYRTTAQKVARLLVPTLDSLGVQPRGEVRSTRTIKL